MTVMLKPALFVADFESVTVTVKFEVVAIPVGVPEITPALLSVRPAGKLPPVRLQE